MRGSTNEKIYFLINNLAILISYLLILISTNNCEKIKQANPNSNDKIISFMNENDFNDINTTKNVVNYENNSSNKNIYFKNLYNFSPDNSNGSCGYVSLIQYLSYYDTFYNDDLIPEIYDRNSGNKNTLEEAFNVSPGVLRQSYPSTNLYEFVQNNKSTDFQMYLMDIVNNAKNIANNEYSCSIGMWDYQLIFDKLYGSNKITYNYVNVSSFNINSKPTDSNIISSFDSYVKKQLDLEKPVILHIAQYDNGNYKNYHSIVAYYYDSNGIHANFGWGKDSTDIIIPSSYQITEAGVMDISNINEKHSNNYIVNNLDYCGCGYHHEHQYTLWKYYTRSLHIEKCSCGALGTLTKPHIVNSSATGRYKRCLDCGYTLDMNSDIAIQPFKLLSKNPVYNYNITNIL